MVYFHKHIISMSISGSKSPALDAMVNGMVNQGLHVVAAAGNDGRDACGYSPGSASSALTVGATTPSDDLYTKSNWGPCVDVLAPGADIRSAYNRGDDDQMSMSGTSMATPLVSGVKALWLSRKSMLPPVLDAIMLNYATKGVIKSLTPQTVNTLLYNLPPPKLFSAENEEISFDKEEEAKSQKFVFQGSFARPKKSLNDQLVKLAEELENLVEKL